MIVSLALRIVWLPQYQCMMTSSKGNIFRVTGPLCEGKHRSPVDSHHKGQWRGALMFSLMSANNRGAGDLRHHHAHYDVTVMDASMEDMCKIDRKFTTTIRSITRTLRLFIGLYCIPFLWQRVYRFNCLWYILFCVLYEYFVFYITRSGAAADRRAVFKLGAQLDLASPYAVPRTGRTEFHTSLNYAKLCVEMNHTGAPIGEM